jgi:hypothetical protein
MRLALAAAAALALLGLLVWLALGPAGPEYRVADSQVFLFPDLRGPEAATPVAEASPAQPAAWGAGAPSRLAVLLTERDSAWLGLVHGLKAIGIPFVVTEDYREALRHRVVLAYPYVSGKVLGKEALGALARFPREGGTLIAQHVLGGELDEVFGFAGEEAVTSSARIRLAEGEALNAEFTEPEERTLRIAIQEDRLRVRGTYAYLSPRNPPLAVYEDGRAAITQKPYAVGRAYALGIDLGHLLLQGHNVRQDRAIAASYANGFAPSLDVLLRLLKRIYEESEPRAATLGTVPGGRPLAAVLTHDVDYTRSVTNSLAYAALERERGVAATYFIQTKYVRDWNDDIFFNRQNLGALDRLARLGMELASHSVAHALGFAAFPIGRGDERYPGYRPFVKERALSYNGTVLGELRVSRFLLDRLVPGQDTVSFRPGHLQVPERLPEALAATRYRYSSSVTANNALTHLPFRMNYGRAAQAEVPVWEFPVTLEDELDPPMLKRLPQAIALARKLARYGGSFVVLIHPDVTGQKLEFERGLLDALAGEAWFGSLAELGRWWSARDAVELDWIGEGAAARLRVRAPEPLRGLAIDVPAGITLAGHAPAGARVSQAGRRIVVEEAAGELLLDLRPLR